MFENIKTQFDRFISWGLEYSYMVYLMFFLVLGLVIYTGIDQQKNSVCTIKYIDTSGVHHSIEETEKVTFTLSNGYVKIIDKESGKETFINGNSVIECATKPVKKQ